MLHHYIPSKNEEGHYRWICGHLFYIFFNLEGGFLSCQSSILRENCFMSVDYTIYGLLFPYLQEQKGKKDDELHFY